MQDDFLKAIDLIASEKIKNINFTKSFTGKVISIDGNDCIVRVREQDLSCIIPESLLNHVDVGEIAIVQDLYNNGLKRVIQGVIWSTMLTEIHVYDPINDVIVSSVLQLWDEELGREVEVTFEVE